MKIDPRPVALDSNQLLQIRVDLGISFAALEKHTTPAGGQIAMVCAKTANALIPDNGAVAIAAHGKDR